MKPNLFIVGAPKCGTCAWFEYLRSHPDIAFSRLKEPHYFSHDFPNWSWAPTKEEYLHLFDGCEHARAVGEASVMYLYSKVAAGEIHEFNPDAKILILLRDQEDFLPSYHQQLLYNRDESIEDFERVWRLSGRRGPDSIPPTCREPAFLDYVAVGRFHEQVQRYFSAFPAEQIRVLFFGEWTVNPRAAYLDILHLLGLKDDCRTEFPRVNEAKHHRSKRVAALTQNPSPAILRASSLLKQLTGRSSLHLAERLRKLNRARGYRSSIDQSLKDEIRRYYEGDNLLTSDLIYSQRLNSSDLA